LIKQKPFNPQPKPNQPRFARVLVDVGPFHCSFWLKWGWKRVARFDLASSSSLTWTLVVVVIKSSLRRNSS
jgi:hypothetical protein